MKLFKRKHRSKLLKSTIVLGVGAVATVGLAIMGIILAVIRNKKAAPCLSSCVSSASFAN